MPTKYKTMVTTKSNATKYFGRRYTITHGKIKIDITDILEFVDTTNTRGNTKKIRPIHTRLNIRKYSYLCRVWNTWNKLPEAVVKATTLNMFKAGLIKTRLFKG